MDFTPYLKVFADGAEIHLEKFSRAGGVLHFLLKSGIMPLYGAGIPVKAVYYEHEYKGEFYGKDSCCACRAGNSAEYGKHRKDLLRDGCCAPSCPSAGV